MRYDANSKDMRRTNMEQFSQFLGINGRNGGSAQTERSNYTKAANSNETNTAPGNSAVTEQNNMANITYSKPIPNGRNIQGNGNVINRRTVQQDMTVPQNRTAPKGATGYENRYNEKRENGYAIRTREATNTGRKSLAMVYPVYQEWEEIYDPELGFTKGTIFSQLDKPFMAYKCYDGGRKGECENDA